MGSIPIIDLARIKSVNISEESKSDWESVSAEIREALHKVGFMYLTNHGVASNIIEKGFEASSRFFSLNQEIKRKYQKNLSISRHGWVEAGQELLHPDSVFEYRECFDFINPKSEPIEEVSDFYENISQFKAECNSLIRKLLKLMGIALKLEDPDFFLNCSTHLENPSVPNETDFSSIYYPPIAKEKIIPEGAIRCAEHTDYEILTLLFQDSVGGLEIKSATGKWISAKPIPGAIMVNTGDLLDFWTNSYFPATTHRVTIPKIEIEKRIPRFSFAYFFAPDNSTQITPLKSEVLNQNSSDTTDFKPVTLTAYEHIIKRVNTAYGY